MNRKGFWITSLVCIAVGVFCFYTAWTMFKGTPRFHMESISDSNMRTSLHQALNTIKAAKEEKTKEVDVVSVSANETVTAETKLVFEYYYTDGEITRREERLPYFMKGLTLTELQEYYDKWTIIFFDDKKVVLRKMVESREEQYIVSIQDGKIAVLFADENRGNEAYHITDIPVASLPEEEWLRLNDGICVTGEEQLARILQNYGS